MNRYVGVIEWIVRPSLSSRYFLGRSQTKRNETEKDNVVSRPALRWLFFANDQLSFSFSIVLTLRIYEIKPKNRLARGPNLSAIWLNSSYLGLYIKNKSRSLAIKSNKSAATAAWRVETKRYYYSFFFFYFYFSYYYSSFLLFFSSSSF